MNHLPLLPRAANLKTQVGPAYTLKVGPAYALISIAELPGNPDIVFPKARVVVFCDGDFWHGRDWEKLQVALSKRHNADYWLAKIGRNRDRDLERTQQLQSGGWHVFRCWETDILRDPGAVATSLKEIVEQRTANKPDINNPPAEAPDQ